MDILCTDYGYEHSPCGSQPGDHVVFLLFFHHGHNEYNESLIVCMLCTLIVHASAQYVDNMNIMNIIQHK